MLWLVVLDQLCWEALHQRIVVVVCLWLHLPCDMLFRHVVHWSDLFLCGFVKKGESWVFDSRLLRVLAHLRISQEVRP